MGEQPFLGAGFLFVTVMTLALIRLGGGSGGRMWAAGWCCLWLAGGGAQLARSWPILLLILPALGTAFGTLLYSGTLRFLGKPVPRWLAPVAVSVGAFRVATAPVSSWLFIEAGGAVVITAGALAATLTLLRTPDPYRARRNLLLAAAFPLAAVGSIAYAFVSVTDTPGWVGIFIWLMAGILLSGLQVVSLVRRLADRTEDERATLAALIQSVPVGLALFDREGKLRAANPTFQKIAGIASPAEPTREAEVVEALTGLLEPTEVVGRSAVDVAGPSSELRLRSGLHLVSARHAVTGARGEPIGRLWLLRDVTEERRLQESLERARRLETLGGFAGGVAHDFNNQLTSVLGNAALLREGFARDPAAREILSDLSASAEYCARLTRDVLDFARRGEGMASDVDLEAQVGPLVARRRDAACIAVRITPGTPLLRTDPTQLARVLENLLDNARDAAGEHGAVEILAGSEPDDRGRVAIEVCDDGPGMDEPLRARVFDPFFTTKPVGKGSGLGLAIVYGIVTAQGGEVRVESHPGGGTRMVTTWRAVASA